ncbi:helix-turn-helix domain-containing protein [Pontibacter sp. HSC-14F20]|uniref:helix-turn-helix domain-containing protein n=1 Tax=Pontibacter sp. HSC-14F20 TaxID=2864136 RepID=UPI001C738E0D|nr:helix-turn-helix domain-containing protein [Pontibacter sp. HSC-14F20]MBX0335467.1 helix-turn-helix domain-containing protein [Pontibacter sp. HSC-14F20]
MSSNIRIQRICQQCGQEFTARTTVTQYCDDKCVKRAYKARQKAAKVADSNRETERKRNRPLEDIKAKEFLTIRDTALLINCSRQTVYNLIKGKILPAVQLCARKTIIKRTDIDKLFQLTPLAHSPEQFAPPTFNPVDCYTLTQVQQQQYRISEKALYDLIMRHNIPKYRQGIYAYVPRKPIDVLLGPIL